MAARKKRKDNPKLEKILITGVAAEGKAIARVNNKVLFVPFAAPGDIVDVQVRKSRQNYMEGTITHVHKLSEEREKPFCIHFALCGGCRWQHLPYEKQLLYKQQQVTDSLLRIGSLDLSKTDVLPIIGSQNTTLYRNKLEFTFSNKRWLSPDEIGSGMEISDLDALGFHIPGFFDKVLDIDKCWLQAEPSNVIRLAVKQFAIKQEMSFFDLRSNKGLLRNLIIRNTPSGEVMVLVVFGDDDQTGIEKMMEYLAREFPTINCLAYMINPKANSSISDLQPVIYRGRQFIEEKMEDLVFRVGPKSFFQTNSLQALRLYEVVRNFSGLSGNETVYDLYTGTGTIALFVARYAGKVVGIEYVDESVAHARVNAKQNNINNTVFVAGNMADVFSGQLLDKEGYPHVIVTDPPRAGMHPKVIKQIIDSGADRIVYVSCNPATHARDIALLANNYALKKSQAVDMFPHTHHVENVALLERIRR